MGCSDVRSGSGRADQIATAGRLRLFEVAKVLLLDANWRLPWSEGARRCVRAPNDFYFFAFFFFDFLKPTLPALGS